MTILSIETIDQFYNDAVELFKQDWDETTSDGIEFEIDEESYRQYEKEGRLLIIAARNERKLIGYIGFIISQSLHHKKNIAMCSGLYVSKENRGKTGSLLMKSALELLKKTQIDKIRISSSVKNDIGKFLERYDFKAEETVYGLLLR